MPQREVLTTVRVQHFGLFPFGQMSMKSSLSFGGLLADWISCQATTWNNFTERGKLTIDTVDICKLNSVNAAAFCHTCKDLAAHFVSASQRVGERADDETSEGYKRDNGGSHICGLARRE